jgi:hypothetical protein
MRNLSLGKIIFCAAITSLFSLPTAAQVTLDIDAGERGPEIGSGHYGLFFEEINHAGDGGLYAELIRNRSFEDNSATAEQWSTLGSATLEITTTDLLNDAQSQAARVTFTKSGDGIANAGFWGMDIVKGDTYRLTFWVRSTANFDGTLTAALQKSDGSADLGTASIAVSVGTTWTKYTAQIVATGSATDGRFALRSNKAGTLCFDVVSLFPPTFKDRENGCRKDLAQLLQDIKPSFIRFPGGCYVEGQYSNGLENRFEWKKTVGGIETRPGHTNANWGYRVSDGFGFQEMLQLCEDLGAAPLFVVNIGLGHGWTQDYNDIGTYIQEALDAIEYANGDATTTYGAMRIANGHPDPFNLKFMEIGNENYNSTGTADQSDHYAERYYQFYQAIKAKYPSMTLIGNVKAWGTDDPVWWNSYPVEMVDEHYYRSPSWFISKYDKYDTYSRTSYKVYSGEYAVTSNYGTTGNLNAAIGEAVYMEGMENNSDVCRMASYAPFS